MPNDPRSIEPPAEIREAARGCRVLYASLVREGFSEQQALALLGAMIAAQIQRSKE